MENPRYAAIVLAGGINTRELYPGYRPDYKARLEVGGRRLLDRVLEALAETRSVEKVGIVGPREELSVTGDYTWAEPGATFLESLRAGLAMFPERERVLVLTADLPLVQATMIDGFVERCARHPSKRPQGLHLALVPADRFAGLFARCRKNMSHFRDITVCHGNLALVSPAVLRNRRATRRVDSVYSARLSPIRSALAVGPWLGLAYLLGVHFFHLLTLAGFAGLLSRSFGVDMVPVLVPWPEVAVDVDEPADLEIARAVLE